MYQIHYIGKQKFKSYNSLKKNWHFLKKIGLLSNFLKTQLSHDVPQPLYLYKKLLMQFVHFAEFPMHHFQLLNRAKF